MPDAPIQPVALARYDSDFAGFSGALSAAFERYGFAVVEWHGIHRELIDAALGNAKAFFALPDDVKRAYAIPGGAGQRGYTPFRIETAKGASRPDLKEFWHTGREDLSGRLQANVWPDEIAGFRRSIGALYTALDDLGGKLLRAVAFRLGLAPDGFAAAVDGGDSVLRLLHYPPLATGADGLRAEAHEDINAITLLLGAEEAGLEILDRDGQWLALNPPSGSLVVNVGDMLQRLTNHVLVSTTHRVANPSGETAGRARHSTPFFLHFAPDFVIRTLPGCIGPDRPDRYPTPITARAYLEERLREIKLAG